MAKKSIVQAMNAIRQSSSENYQANVMEIDESTGIQEFTGPLLSYPNLLNEFTNQLIQRIVYTKFETKIFNNPLKFLEGDSIPLGYIGQEIFINPAQGRDYDINDFAGLLQKYESDIKVQYPTINFDKQYPVTVIREKLKQAFTTWDNLETYINNLTQSLYNGAYIDEYRATKQLISSAYKTNSVQLRKINGITSEELAKQFISNARTLYLNFQLPSSEYNAWKKVGGYGREILTFCNPDDIVFIIRNDIASYIDVNVLASSFNIDRSSLLGRIVYTDNFDEFDAKGKKVFDGKNIVALIADKSWFRIKTQDMYMEDFRNANNRSINYYLNFIKMFQYSFFSNAVVFCTEEPEISIKSMDFQAPEGITLNVNNQEGLDLTVLPANATSPEIEYTSSNEGVFTVAKDSTNDRHCVITGVAEGSGELTATAGGITAKVNITVNPES